MTATGSREGAKALGFDWRIRPLGFIQVFSSNFPEIPVDPANGVWLDGRVGTGFIEARIDALLIVFGDALVGLARHPPEPGELIDLIVDPLSRVALHEPDQLHRRRRRVDWDESIKDPVIGVSNE